MRRILAGMGRVTPRCVLFSLVIAVALVLAGSSFFGSGQAEACRVQVTSWTTVTSYTTTSSTIATGIEIQTITIIAVVVVAALTTVAALSRIVRKPSVTLPAKPGSQLPGESEGKLFYEGYEGYGEGRPDIPSPEESSWPVDRKSLHVIGHPEEKFPEPFRRANFWRRGGEEGGGSGASGWREGPRGEGAGREPEGEAPEGSEAEGSASGEGGGEPARSPWGDRGKVERAGGNGPGVSGWSGAHRGGGAGGGSVSQAGSEASGPSQEPSGPASHPPEGGSEAKAPSSDVVSTPEKSSKPFTPYTVAGPVVAGPGSDESTAESTTTTPTVVTAPAAPSDQTEEKPRTGLTEDEIEHTVNWGLEHNRPHKDIMNDLNQSDKARGGSGDVKLDDPLTSVETENGRATVRASEKSEYESDLAKIKEINADSLNLRETWFHLQQDIRRETKQEKTVEGRWQSAGRDFGGRYRKHQDTLRGIARKYDIPLKDYSYRSPLDELGKIQDFHIKALKALREQKQQALERCAPINQRARIQWRDEYGNIQW